VELLPVLFLAALALALRVDEYGWTVRRIYTVGMLVVLGVYATGYLLAALRSPRWQKRIEMTNFVAAYIGLAVLLALFSPLADPARLMVASQTAALLNGKITQDGFDYMALRVDGAVWGTRALTMLAARADPAWAVAADRAKKALSGAAIGQPQADPTAAELRDHISMFPAGKQWPAELFDDVDNLAVKAALRTCRFQTCTARFMQMLPVPNRESLILFTNFSGFVFDTDASGHWIESGILYGEFFCPGFRESVRSGDFAVKAHPMPDVVVDGRVFSTGPVHNNCARFD
jgi:hypothetical protein